MSKRPVRINLAPPGPYSEAAFTRAMRSVAEAVAAPPRQRVAIAETTAVVEATKAKPGRLLVQLIRSGWSLNGNYYPAEVLRRDGPAAWPAGTQCFVDHATDEEDDARPAGSVKNLAAVQTQAAYWDESRQALLAEVRLFAPWREAITDMADTIGMSIRAWVYGEHGDAEGRTGLIVSGIPEGRSVDFVTIPAAGGAIVSVLESVGNKTAEARNIGVWLESRLHLALTQLGDDMYGDGMLTRDERITLSAAIGDALQAWTARVETDAPQLFQRDLYDEPDPGPTGQVTAEAAPPTSATAVTETDVTAGAPPAAPNPLNKEEPEMSGTQTGAPPSGEAGTATSEAQSATEATAQARAAILEAERDQLRQRANAATEQLAEAQAEARRAAASAAEATAEMRRLRANEAARITVDRLLVAQESGVEDRFQALIGPRVHTSIRDHVPLTDAGEVNQEALEAAVTAAIRSERVHLASGLEAAGVGRVAGLGADGDPHTQMTEAQFEGGMSKIFESIGMPSTTAALAAKGR